MKIYLAGIKAILKDLKQETLNDLYVLESFFYMNESFVGYIPQFKEFLLDSGAFTYMQGTSVGTNWDGYVEKYAEFVKKYSIKLFFELDIDCIVGLQEVERLRKKLEAIVGRQCIPVWHRARGKDYWLRMVEEYKYVSIGGIISGEIKRKDFPVFDWFLTTALKKDCKVHGLGFTYTELLKQYHFYSVDSTYWNHGNRFGFVFNFKNGVMEEIDREIGMKLKDAKEVLKHNFLQWVRFQKHAEINL